MNFNSRNNSALKNLILTLTKSEKRYFKLYCKRNSSREKNYQFVDLFDVIDKYKTISTAKLMVYFPDFSTKQIADFKRNLYAQLLNCLRQYNSEREEFKINNQIESAKVLYSKGLYIDTLNLLKSIKNKALKKQNHMAVYEIIDFEKKIESIHITRSHSDRSIELEAETNSIRKILKSEGEWSEFSLKLYSKFIQNGHIKSNAEQIEISAYFNLHKPKIRDDQNKFFFESLYQYQAYEWYYFINRNFKLGYKYSILWIQLFDRFPAFKKSHPQLLIKGLHNCLSILFNCSDEKRHHIYFKALEKIAAFKQLDINTKLIAFIYVNTARLNKVILSGKFSQSKTYLVQFENELSNLDKKIDDYRLMIFWYKMASIYFTMGDYTNCNRLLNNIINPNQKKLREDLQCFARLLSLITHFELDNDELLVYSIKSTYRFLLSMNESTKLHKALIEFLRTSLFKKRLNLKNAFVNLKLQLDDLNSDPFEQRSFLYLDIISWLESKIERKPVEVIIFSKRQKLDITSISAEQ